MEDGHESCQWAMGAKTGSGAIGAMSEKRGVEKEEGGQRACQTASPKREEGKNEGRDFNPGPPASGGPVFPVGRGLCPKNY